MGEEGTEQWAAIVLAAGYGSRLEAGLAEDPEFAHLTGIPKALLPCGGVALLDHWLHKFRVVCRGLVGPVLLVTNETFKPVFDEWALKRKLPTSNIISDGSWTNDTRLGAVRDLELIIKAKADVIKQKNVVVSYPLPRPRHSTFGADKGYAATSCGTPGPDGARAGSEGEVGLVYYNVDDSEVSKRGISPSRPSHSRCEDGANIGCAAVRNSGSRRERNCDCLCSTPPIVLRTPLSRFSRSDVGSHYAAGRETFARRHPFAQSLPCYLHLSGQLLMHLATRALCHARYSGSCFRRPELHPPSNLQVATPRTRYSMAGTDLVHHATSFLAEKDAQNAGASSFTVHLLRSCRTNPVLT
eukprot:2139786-Rhodomonas_salina.2